MRDDAVLLRYVFDGFFEVSRRRVNTAATTDAYTAMSLSVTGLFERTLDHDLFILRG